MLFLNTYFIPSLVTLFIHSAILIFMIFGWNVEEQPRRIEPPKFIEAKLVQLEMQSQKKSSAEKQPKKIDLTARRKEQERLKREAEQRQRAQAEKEKAAALKKAEEKKKIEEAERKEREAQAQREREQQRLQQEFEEALKKEEGMLLEQEYATEAQSYASKIKQRIESNWSPPPSARTGMQCELSIQLVPTGRVVAVNLIKSSGNSAFDRSAIQAVKKVELFPEVKEMSPEVFERHFRKFTMLFNPQDLRL